MALPEIEITDVSRVDASKDGLTIWLVCADSKQQEFALKLAYSLLGQFVTIIAAASELAHKNQVAHTPDPASVGASIATILPVANAQVATSPEAEGVLFQFQTTNGLAAGYQLSVEQAREFAGALQTCLENIAAGGAYRGPKTH